jgi:ABC-type branched-subunit amino acid transport system substrate-binding protein
MSDCLHCEINQLVQERFERGDTDLAEMASMMVESLADLILLAPESDRSNLMAHALSALGQIFLEKGGAIDGGSNATH